jgi:hypothetical protein
MQEYNLEKPRRMHKYAPLVKSPLPFVVGAVLDVAGKVQKVVKRDGQCKLIIEPGNAPGFVVFADCTSDAENLTKLNIRKGSLVLVRGKFQSFGASAVCLSDCRLMPEGNLEQLGTLKKKIQRRNRDERREKAAKHSTNSTL